jgi:hypothetical protein
MTNDAAGAKEGGMAELKVNWMPEKLITFEELLKRPGYYLNAISGDIYRYDEVPEATQASAGAIQRAYEQGETQVDPHIWLFITDDLDLSEGDVRGVLHDQFRLKKADQGRFLTRTVWRAP